MAVSVSRRASANGVGQRLFAIDVQPGFEGAIGGRRVRMIGRRDENGVQALGVDQLAIVHEEFGLRKFAFRAGPVRGSSTSHMATTSAPAPGSSLQLPSARPAVPIRPTRRRSSFLTGVSADAEPSHNPAKPAPEVARNCRRVVGISTPRSGWAGSLIMIGSSLVSKEKPRASYNAITS